MSKPVLFTYPQSIWASVPQLAIREVGYASSDIENRVIDLGRGENFDPAFLDITKNPKGTVPTLVAGGQTYTSTAEVTSYLVKHAPKPVKPGTSFVALIHEDKYDPNFPLLLARSDRELERKGSMFVIDFVNNRQDALRLHSSESDASRHKAFYDSKFAGNRHLLSIYQGNASEDDKQVFFHSSTTHWNNLKQFISDDLAKLLPDTGFLGGVNPGEDDFHLAAWLTRIASVAGAGKEQDGIRALENSFNIKLHPKIGAYWGAWSSRKSWQDVYVQGLH